MKPHSRQHFCLEMRRPAFLFCLVLGVVSAGPAAKCNLFHFAIENDLECGPMMPGTWKPAGAAVRCSCRWRCHENQASTFVCNDDGQWYSVDKQYDCLKCGAVDCSIPTDLYHKCKQRDRGNAVSGVVHRQIMICTCKSNRRFYGLSCQADGSWAYNSRAMPPCS